MLVIYIAHKFRKNKSNILKSATDALCDFRQKIINTGFKLIIYSIHCRFDFELNIKFIEFQNKQFFKNFNSFCVILFNLIVLIWFISYRRWTRCRPRHVDRNLQQNTDPGIPSRGGSCNSGHEGRTNCGGQKTGECVHVSVS